jgi:Tfp pilus assembly protein FimT
VIFDGYCQTSPRLSTALTGNNKLLAQARSSAVNQNMVSMATEKAANNPNCCGPGIDIGLDL